MNAILLDVAKALPLSERIELAEALWENIAEAGYEPPLPAAQAAELDRRVAEHRRNPEAAVPWNRVRAESAALHLAIGLFVTDEATLGQASAVAGMPQARFLKELGSRRIPIHYGAEELASDLAAVADLSPR